MTVGLGTYGHWNILIKSWDMKTRIHIGKYCSIADEITVFLGGGHDTTLISTYPIGENPSKGKIIGGRLGHPTSRGDIVIGNDVWIGSNVSIMSGVKIGDGAVIAAFSHVVRDVGAYEIVGGNPAQHIKFRFDEQTIKELLQLAWWEWEEDEIIRNANHLKSKPSSALHDKFVKDYD